MTLLSGLREGGDRSEATTIALALAYAAQARVLESRTDPQDLPTNERAAISGTSGAMAGAVLLITGLVA